MTGQALVVFVRADSETARPGLSTELVLSTKVASSSSTRNRAIPSPSAKIVETRSMPAFWHMHHHEAINACRGGSTRTHSRL